MIKQTIKRATQALLLVPVLGLVISSAGVPVVAGCSASNGSQGSSGNVTSSDLNTDPLGNGTKCAKGAGQGTDLTSVFRTVANIMLFLVGAIAVIMLIVGGLRYVTSGGDQTAVKGAKDTILYAIVGIVVAFLAFAAVNFVTTQLGTGGGGVSGTIITSPKF